MRTIVTLVTATSLITACVAESTEPAQNVDENEIASCGLAPGDIGSFIPIAGGSFEKGRDPLYPEEGSPMRLQVAGFAVQSHEVTNNQFAAFVEETSYVTDAERRGDSGVFVQPSDGNSTQGQWRLVRGANWLEPNGPGSDLAGLGDHPVVHVSQNDARAYAEWTGGRLPTEVEWEYAAVRGLSDPENPYSGAFDANGTPIANSWQGIFPLQDTGSDGFSSAAAVGCFPPSEIGAYDMIGNVWEWTDTPFGEGNHTIKGGSYLCAENFCRRYRPASRQPQESDFSMSHIGFRIVRDAPNS